MHIVPSDELADQDFGAITLREPYGLLTGPIERKTGMYVWGPEGSGKSTLALGLARAVVPHALANGGTVLYASREEGPDRKTRDRAERIGAAHPALLISDFETLDALKDAMEDYGVEFLVIDSVTALNLRSSEAQAFVKWVQDKGIGLIAVSHANKKGQAKGETYLPHMLDIVIKCYPVEHEGKKIHVAEATKNRYAELTTMRIPMTADEVGEDITMAQARRENPDCTETPQTDQCKAIFAKLQESGEYDPAKAGADGVSKSDEATESEHKPQHEEREVALTRHRPELLPRTVIQEARDMQGRLLGYLTARHDGSRDDVVRAADDLRDEAIARWSRWSNINSRTGFTDEDGDAYVMSPNRQHIAPAGSTDARAMMGDEEAIRQLFGKDAPPVQEEIEEETEAPEKPQNGRGGSGGTDGRMQASESDQAQISAQSAPRESDVEQDLDRLEALLEKAIQ